MQAPTLPGIPNIHSHAFQRAMAGLAERQGAGRDSFWTWRERMYGFAGRLTPESLRDVATQLYVEMLEAGYTSVCEFHYLHHAPDGRPYSDPSAMSLALVEAAREAGIRLTLLPVLYMCGGFDGRALSERQRRFGHELDDYRRLVEALLPHEDATVRIGLALHSLRAVPADAMRDLLSDRPGGAGRPLHIHIAEQVIEVEECQALRGARPVEWLLGHADVGPDWTLVHATHLVADEVEKLAASGAVVALCPTTEANLGDGLFPLRDSAEQVLHGGAEPRGDLVAPRMPAVLHDAAAGHAHLAHQRRIAGEHEAVVEIVVLRAGQPRAVRVQSQAVGVLPRLRDRLPATGNGSLQQAAPGARLRRIGADVALAQRQPLAVFEPAQFFHRRDGDVGIGADADAPA